MKWFEIPSQDVLSQFFNWALRSRNWGTLDGIAACILFAAVSFAILFWAFEKCLSSIAKVAESWQKLGFPLSKTPEQKAALRNKHQFCKVLVSDLGTIAKAENWNDQWFTDLEAEVEFEGRYYANSIDKLLNRITTGLVRLPSLMKAIEGSAEQFLMVVGSPGSGKSIALRHLAVALSERAAKSRDFSEPIPLYINLKELPPAPPGGPTANFIREFVLDNIRRGDSDTADYVRQHWQEFRSKGIWVFLFDSFDEIPAVLHAPSGSQTIESHATAIRQFLQGMSNCRGVLASREFKGPKGLTWHKLKLASLTLKKQRELVRNAFLSPELQELIDAHLLVRSSRLASNPLFLSLLCRYVKDEKHIPLHDHALLLGHLKKLARRDAEYVARHFRLSPSDLIGGAENLAVLFAEDPSLSLAPTRDEIRDAYQRRGNVPQQLDELLSSLVYVKIGRCDVPYAAEGERRFTFSHRRFQESLYVQYLADNAATQNWAHLLLDVRWREYTVTFLQTQAEEELRPLLKEAISLLSGANPQEGRALISKEYGGHLYYYDWTNNSTSHVLLLLQEGLASRPQLVSEDLQRAASGVLDSRWRDGDMYDGTRVLEVACLHRPGDLLAKVRWAIGKGPNDMRDAAFLAAQFLDTSSPDINRWLRTRLADRVLNSESDADVKRLAALAAKMPRGIGAQCVYDRCVEIRRWLKALIYAPINRVRSIARMQEATPLASGKIPGTSLFLSAFVFAIFLKMAEQGWAQGRIVCLSITVAFLALATALCYLAVLYMFRSVGAELRWSALMCHIRLPEKSTISGYCRATTFTISVIVLPALSLHVFLLYRLNENLPAGKYVTVCAITAFIINIVIAVGKELQQQKYRKQLRAVRTKTVRAFATPLLASSLEELTYWLRIDRRRLISQVHNVRSLMRFLESGKAFTPDSIANAPLCRAEWNRRSQMEAIQMLLSKTRLRNQVPRRRRNSG